MKYVVNHAGVDVEVDVHENEDGSFKIEYDGQPIEADFEHSGSSKIYSLILDGKSYELLIFGDDKDITVVSHERRIELLVESERERNARLIVGDADEGDGESVTAVMPGIVVAVAVEVGQVVAPGDGLVVLEAMKMENEIRATTNGRVAEVAVVAGQTVNPGDLLVEIVALEED